MDYNQALEHILEAAVPLTTEKLLLLETWHRVLAHSVFSDIDLPPFHKSAMDGYACRKEDLEKELTVIETIPAGKKPEKEIGAQQCAKIMTGAVIPFGANCVFMQEDAKLTANNKVVCLNIHTKTNICYQGEDVKTGNRVISANTLIQARHLPVLAGAGSDEVWVYKQPEIAVFSSGSELVEWNQTPLPHQIRNTNAAQITGQLASMGIKSYYGGILKDEKREIERTITDALKTNNLLLLTGGVSVGEYDLIPAILENAGFEIIIRKTAIQPGRPMIFARRNQHYCFGLSGNPVSSFIQFELYTKPFIYKLMGYDYHPPRYQLPLSTAIQRKKADRLQLKPGKIVNNCVQPLTFHGSAHINSLTDAHCLIELPVGIEKILENQLATIRIL